MDSPLRAMRCERCTSRSSSTPAESASIAFDGANPVAVPVIADGVDASEPFSLLFQLRETPPDAASFAGHRS